MTERLHKHKHFGNFSTVHAVYTLGSMSDIKTSQAVDEYIASFSPELQQRLLRVRETIWSVTPLETYEKMSYGIPTYVLGGNLIHFGCFPNHIGLYPGPAAIEQLRDRLSAYTTSKGTVQFPHDEPIPQDLIAEITRFCVAHQLAIKRK